MNALIHRRAMSPLLALAAASAVAGSILSFLNAWFFLKVCFTLLDGERYLLLMYVPRLALEVLIGLVALAAALRAPRHLQQAFVGEAAAGLVALAASAAGELVPGVTALLLFAAAALTLTEQLRREPRGVWGLVVGRRQLTIVMLAPPLTLLAGMVVQLLEPVRYTSMGKWVWLFVLAPLPVVFLVNLALPTATNFRRATLSALPLLFAFPLVWWLGAAIDTARGNLIGGEIGMAFYIIAMLGPLVGLVLMLLAALLGRLGARLREGALRQV